MARGEQIQRHWNLLRMLQTRGEGIPLRQLADDFDVSERTIQRDFEMLQELGFPIEHDEDDYGKRFWHMPHDFFRTGPLVLSLTEAVSLHLAERLFAPLTGTPFAEGLRAVLQKIRSSVPEQALDYFAGLEETLHVRRVGVTDYSAQADTIRTLTNAARTCESVEITYRSLWRGAALIRCIRQKRRFRCALSSPSILTSSRSHLARQAASCAARACSKSIAAAASSSTPGSHAAPWTSSSPVATTMAGRAKCRMAPARPRRLRPRCRASGPREAVARSAPAGPASG